jgi:alanine dehydrogenase
VRRLAKNGWKKATQQEASLRGGLNIVEGKITHAGVAEAFGLEYVAPESVLQN